MKESLELYFDVFNLLAKENILLWNVHYDTTYLHGNRHVLRIRYREAINKVREYYSNKLNYNNSSNKNGWIKNINLSWFNEKKFKDELTMKPYFVESDVPVYFYCDENEGQKSLFKCIAIDIIKLKEAGAQIDDLVKIRL